MKILFTPLTVAMVMALTPFSGVVFAQTTKTPAAPAAHETPPVVTQSSTDWSSYDDITYTPVADEISQHLAAARQAFVLKDNKKAAEEMRAVANVLKNQAARVVQADQAPTEAEMQRAQDTAKGIDRAAKEVNAAAAALERGEITTQEDLDKVLEKAARAQPRWLVTDVNVWYRVSEKPQRHFDSALDAYVKKDYQAAATEIRKATSYVRLEAGRASSEAQQALETSVAGLDTLAASLEKETVKDGTTLVTAFTHSNYALAVAHRAQAAESWTRKEYEMVGYEFKAAAQALESAAGWAGAEAKAAAAPAVAETNALGDKLASGATWTREEVAKGFESLGNAINALGQKIGSNKKAEPIHAGS